MFQVLAVDDEPAALEFIGSLIQARCQGFSLMGTAANGRDCLELMKQKQPDVLLTDARMPVMDGIELARRVSDAYPQVRIIVVSGYQQFDYVHGALQCGVYDYLLKPLVPSAFAAVFARLREVLEEELLARRNRILRMLSRGEYPGPGQIERCFFGDTYDCVLVRRNGLPKRFAAAGPPEIFESREDSLAIFGRDEMERIYLRPSGPALDEYVSGVLAREERPGAYLTAVFTRTPFPVARLAGVLRSLYRALDTHTVLGVTQAVCLEAPFRRAKLPAVDEASLKHLETYLQTGNIAQARQELQRLMDEWARRRMPQLWLERQLRYILFLAQRTGRENRLTDVEEHLLDDAFYSICSMEEMAAYMDDLLFGEAQGQQEQHDRMDTQETFDHIRAYVRANFAQDLSIQDLARAFGISQSYLSKMFRRYEGRSFNAFLAETRIGYACALMRADPGAYIKEIALMVGYADPFYFSKTFRVYTGMSPKEYLAMLNKGGAP